MSIIWIKKAYPSTFATSRIIGVNILVNKFGIFNLFYTTQNTPIQQKSLILNSLQGEKQFTVSANLIYTSTPIDRIIGLTFWFMVPCKFWTEIDDLLYVFVLYQTVPIKTFVYSRPLIRRWLSVQKTSIFIIRLQG